MNKFEPILIFTCCYAMAFIITWMSKLNNSNRLFGTDGKLAKDPVTLIGLHIGGILLLGIIPAFIFKRSLQDILSASEPATIAWLCSFLFVFMLVAVAGYMASSRIQIENDSLHILSGKFLSHYFIIRILFLCSYELFFRGLLLFNCIKWFGILPAVLISTMLTVLIHLFTNKKEMWMCIPYGIVLCYFSISIHAVWPAMLLHAVLSITYEIPAVNIFLTQLKPSK